MINKILTLILVIASMLLLIHLGLGETQKNCPALVLGLILLAAYCFGFLLEKIGLPRIVGYILAGLFMGPFFLKLYTLQEVNSLAFINKLALAFIAFCAGGELRLVNIRKVLKSIVYYISGVTIVVFIGTTSIVFLLSNAMPFMSDFSPTLRLAVSAIFGTIAVARSPSSAIAIISETKSKGPYTDIVLSVSVAMDVFIIILFAVVISLVQIFIKGQGGLNFSLVFSLLFEISAAFLLGFLLGKLIVFLIEKIHMEFPVVIIAMGFIVIEFSHLLGDYLQQVHDIRLELEPLLICMAAGFTVQNFSKQGEIFLQRMDRVSLPIYIAFFAMTGAAMNLKVLRTGWLLGLVVFVVRLISIYVGSFVSGRLAKNQPKIYKNVWLGFITQAGVSLGLLSEVARRFPEIGPSIQTILVAAIIMNQIIGPIAFKYGLKKAGETQAQRSS
ncbi:MAG TPA: cation:proton antiporter [Acidobacteriota bacterium]|nr:cation:proton antiporter [Acidobacteriota bacterium]